LGFGPEKFESKPTAEEIEVLKKQVGFNKITFKNGKYSRSNKNVYTDFSAIAKGYGVDHILTLIQKNKFDAALVEIGGEVRAYGVKPNGKFWKVGIEKPNDQPSKAAVQKVVPLSDMAMATSGSYRNYRKFGNEVFSHTMDPRTGYPVKHSLISVSVINTTCAMADAYATTLMVMGPEEGFDFAETMGIPAYFLFLNSGKMMTSETSAFKQYFMAVGDEK
jgi:thiamine biosynthesis lipoprotein